MTKRLANYALLRAASIRRNNVEQHAEPSATGAKTIRAARAAYRASAGPRPQPTD